MNLPLPIVYTDALERNIRLSDHTELPEIVLDIWGSRGDLKAVFPDPKTVYLERKNSDFKSWIFTQGFNEYLGLGHFYQFYVLRTDCLFRDLEIKNNQSVAIVLPTRDRLVSLGKSLDAVAKQSYSNWHLYLIDGSKNSDARQLAYEILGNNKVTYLKENLEPQIVLEQRVSSARNLGMRSSKEDLIAHLDDDNVWTPDHLSKLVAAMDADPLLAMAFSLHKVLDKNTGLCHSDPVRVAHNAFQRYSIDILLAANFIASDDVLMRRSVFNDLGGFRQDLPFLADWDYWSRIALRFPVVQIFELLSNYYVHKDSITSKLEDSRFISRIKREVSESLSRHRSSLLDDSESAVNFG